MISDNIESQMVRLVSAYGPRNMSRIAHRLNVSRGTAVRTYAKLTEEGIGPRPNVRMDRLGLQRYVAIVRPGEKSDPKKLDSLLMLMGDYAYLEHCQNLAPSNGHLLIFSCPPSLQGDMNEFLGKLVDGGEIRVVGPEPLSWMRFHPIRAPWNPPPTSPVISGPLDYVPTEEPMRQASFEYQELLLLAALQAYPNANLVGLSDALAGWADTGYEDIKEYGMCSSSEWNLHFRRALRFVDSYPVHRSRGEPGVTKKRRHKWATFTTLWEGLSPAELKRASMASTSVPYLRTDAACQKLGVYFSITSSPSRLIPGYVNFMGQNGPEGMNVGMPSRFMNFSLPFAAFVPEEGRWAWKQERMEAVLATVLAR